VPGVEVGQTTIVSGDSVRTGVTAILPHPGNMFIDKVPGAVFVGNGFGKLMGSTQVNELGEIETPILLTSTLSVPRVADALIDYMLALPGNEDIKSINPVVGETNDGRLNDIRGRHISHDDVINAIKSANSGPVQEGGVGAGTGTIAFGFKGGIGTSSRRLPASLGGYTVGVLVQSNFGGVLTICGAPVGEELGRYYLKDVLNPSGSGTASSSRKENASPGSQSSLIDGPSSVFQGPDFVRDDLAGGSIMMVVATDAPVDQRNLRRMAMRAIMGLGRTGSSGTTDSGDYVIAFSTASQLRIQSAERLHPYDKPTYPHAPQAQDLLPNDAMSPLFLAVIESTEEAIYNSLFRATTTTGRDRTVEAIPIKETVDILRRHGLLENQK